MQQVASREKESSSNWSLQTGHYLLRLELLARSGLALGFPGGKQETLDDTRSVVFLTFPFEGHTGKGREFEPKSLQGEIVKLLHSPGVARP